MKIEIEIPEAVLDAIAAKVAAQIKPTLMRSPESRAQAEELMSVGQLAAHLGGVSRDWIYQRTAANEIPFVKVGRLLKFRRSDIDVWLKEQSIPAVAPFSGPLPPKGRGIRYPEARQNQQRRRMVARAVK